MKDKKIVEKFKSNGLYHRANKYRKFPTNEDEIEQIDMTDVYNAELDYMVSHGEIISININAKMRLGKSTAGLSEADKIFKLLVKHGIRKKGERFGVVNIAHDQSEYADKMRDPATTFTVIAVDEENESEETGQDTSVIKAQQNDFSNIHADRYVHRVSMSPKSISDGNADILLYITGVNEVTMETHAKLYYRYWEGQVEYTQILGYIRIPVKHIIKDWIETIRPLFYKKLQLEADISKYDNNKKSKVREDLLTEIGKLNRRIREAQKTDWYVHYYMKKRKRLDLLTKYKITKPRILKYAPVILRIITRFERIIPYQALIKREIIKNNVKLEMKKIGIPQSIVGEELTTQEVMGIIEAMKSFYIVSQQIKKLEKSRNDGKITEGYFEVEKHNLEAVKKDMKENVQLQVDEYKKCIELLEEYNREE